MRITNNMLINNMMNNLGTNLNRMQQYQSQVSTGKKISKASDDPVVAARALKLHTDVAEIDQYQRNVDDASSWMEITEKALSDVNDIMQRTRELVVQASNSSNSQDDMSKIGEEIKQLKSQMVHVANTTYAGRNIFSGFKTDLELMNEDGTFAMDVDMDEKIEYEIGIGDNIEINVTGGDLFHQGANAVNGEKSKLIQDYDNLMSALSNGDNEAISSIIGDFDEDMANLLRVRSEVGAKMNRLELTQNRLDGDYEGFTKLMSLNEDVDMAEAIMNLSNEENVYNASLAAGAKVIQPSLVDFLR